MADFITNSACNGCKPRHLQNTCRFQRSELLSRMMRKRDVVRFLIAPAGFGKTSLAAEYAESIFSFRNVFWVNAQSPCFLRDIDKGVLAQSLFAHATAPSLAVFEDIPDIDEGRNKSVAQCIDALIERGWEVVISMRPECSALADYEPDSIRIQASNFLLTDQELERLVEEGMIKGSSARSLSPTDRIPGIVIGGRKGATLLLKALVEHGIQSDVALGIFSMIVLGRGSFDALDIFTGPLKSDTRTLLANSYLFVGVDTHNERFCAYSFPIEDIVSVFAHSLPLIASASPFEKAGTLVTRLADVLLAGKQYDRACKLVHGLGDSRRRIAWLEARSGELAAAGCLLSAHNLFESKMLRLGSQTAKVFCQEARRLAVLGDTVCALELADRVLNCSVADDDVRASAALLVTRLAGNKEREAAVKALRGIAHIASGRDTARMERSLRGALTTGESRWKILSIGSLWLADDVKNCRKIIDVCCACETVATTETMLLLSTFEEIGRAKGGPTAVLDRDSMAEILMQTGDYLRRCAAAHSVGLLEVALLSQWDALRMVSPPDVSYPQLEIVRAGAHAVQARIIAQRSAYERLQREDHVAPWSGSVTAQAARWDIAVARAEAAPVLHLTLFGGLEASIDGRMINPALLRRQKVKTLLALLALNQGKELLRIRLSALLWPDSSSETAQRNFYAIWSMLRKALSDSAGACPYLHRLQYGCKLDSNTVTSDIAEFDLLCNHLLFDPPDIEAWSSVYVRLSELYRGDLLPSESKNEFIDRARGEYRARLVDALVAASTRLYEYGNLQVALWFAHAAVKRDATREDAYTALMRSQIATGQRTAALDTYFKCKHYLSDELGIDPSPQAVLLYQTIIAEEPNLSTFSPRMDFL